MRMAGNLDRPPPLGVLMRRILIYRKCNFVEIDSGGKVGGGVQVYIVQCCTSFVSPWPSNPQVFVMTGIDPPPSQQVVTTNVTSRLAWRP